MQGLNDLSAEAYVAIKRSRCNRGRSSKCWAFFITRSCRLVTTSEKAIVWNSRMLKGNMRLQVRFKHKEGPIGCDVCGKTCSNRKSQYAHQKWVHLKPPFECEICHRRMVSQENLDQHVLLEHKRRESVVYEECDKSFTENR